MGSFVLVVWMLVIATIIGLWLVGFGLIVRGVQQYLLVKPTLLYRRLIGRGAGLVLLGCLISEVLASTMR